MINSNEMMQELKTGTVTIMKQAAGHYAAQATSDAKDFLTSSKPLLTQWAQQVGDGQMSQDEYQFLVKGRIKDLAKMRALTEAGIAAATMDAIRDQIVSLAVTILVKQV
jgi:hypothetical protein